MTVTMLQANASASQVLVDHSVTPVWLDSGGSLPEDAKSAVPATSRATSVTPTLVGVSAPPRRRARPASGVWPELMATTPTEDASAVVAMHGGL